MINSAKQSILRQSQKYGLLRRSAPCNDACDLSEIRKEIRRGRIKPERPALLLASQRPWPQARPFQRDHRPTPDRLDLVAGRQGQYQSRALQLLQRLLLHPSHYRLFLDGLEGQRRQYPGDRRIRLESGDHGSGETDERHRGACRPRRQRIQDRRTDGSTQQARQRAPGGGEPGLVRMQADPDRSTAGRRRQEGAGLAHPRRGRRRSHRQGADQGRRLPDRAGAPDRARRAHGRLFRNQAGCHVRDGAAGLSFFSLSPQAGRGEVHFGTEAGLLRYPAAQGRFNFSLFSKRSVHPNPATSGTMNYRAADHEDIAMTSFAFRRDIITKPIFSWARTVLPVMSDTEREALEAGDVWWDADLFTGNPDWTRLLSHAPATLTAEEQAFLNGPVDELCAMLDDWKINWEWRDLPPEVWDYIKARKFFGMIIPKEYGGLGFSPYAHSAVVRKISSRSLTAAVTVMVPNSLGPGELLMRFGTKDQQQAWLPRLADGREIPCFGLTSPEAGSDAASMIDSGIICKGNFEGREVLGLRLNWHKRYITLGPVATLLGLAFKAYDPDHLVGPQDELGITVALIPTHLPGVEIGHRHLPSMQVFQNGPNWGRDVFIPMDYIIGGQERLGQGWKMLMTALAADDVVHRDEDVAAPVRTVL